MARPGKPLPDLHIPFANLGKLSSSDLLAIDGPKFITSSSAAGTQTLAVLVSHDKWKKLNHSISKLDPHNADIVFLDEQAYLVIPMELDRDCGYENTWKPRPETGAKVSFPDKPMISTGRVR